jgi:membrane protein
MGTLINELLAFPPPAIEIVNFSLSFGFTALMVALGFRYIPDRSVDWHSIWVGAVVTAFLEALGKSFLGLYLGTAGVGSAYGAASSILAIAIWMYYAAQIFLLGAEFTNVYSTHRAGRLQLSP